MLEQNYNQVFVEDECLYTEIHPEYVYLTIPSEYICVYHKLLVALIDFGKDIQTNNCTSYNVNCCGNKCCANSKKRADITMACWNMFQCALANRQIGNIEQADIFIKNIDKLLIKLYSSTGKRKYNGTLNLSITPDGKLKTWCSCGDNIKFIVDINTGELYQQYLNSINNGNVFVIEDENLIIKQ